MKYRNLGDTGLKISEIGLGARWLERHNAEEVKAVIDCCEERGINILDCWMSEPNVRSNIGAAPGGGRDKWIIQRHLGSTWQDGQHVRTRGLSQVRAAFIDLLKYLKIDCIDLEMIHFVDEPGEFHRIMGGEFTGYVRELKESGVIRHIGVSTYNPAVTKLAALNGEIEMILFDINPIFDMLPATNDLNKYFEEAYDKGLDGVAPEWEKLYRICEQRGVGITVMKGYAGGHLFSAQASPFGVALAPVQCLHYALARPAVASTMAGYDTSEHVMETVTYETASKEEKDCASVLANAPHHAYSGQYTCCGRCVPCPPGIDTAMVNKLHDLAAIQEEVPMAVRVHYASLFANADDCIDCQGCESRCPFGVPVTERMEKARKLLREK